MHKILHFGPLLPPTVFRLFAAHLTDYVCDIKFYQFFCVCVCVRYHYFSDDTWVWTLSQVSLCSVCGDSALLIQLSKQVSRTFCSRISQCVPYSISLLYTLIVFIQYLQSFSLGAWGIWDQCLSLLQTDWAGHQTREGLPQEHSQTPQPGKKKARAHTHTIVPLSHKMNYVNLYEPRMHVCKYYQILNFFWSSVL